MEDVKFDFKVVNWDLNGKDIEMFNIFRNCEVNKWTNIAVRKYLRKKYTKEEFVKELDETIQWQEWGRVEYEIMVGDMFEEDINKFKRMDCYTQAHANIKIIADYVIKTYKEAVKKNKLEKKLAKENKVETVSTISVDEETRIQA